MGTVDIDFNTFILMVAGIFGLSGFVRGWWKEAITTALLILLLVLLREQELAASIIESINSVIRLGATFFSADSLEVEALAAAANTVEPPVVIDPSQFTVYLGLLIFLIVASYFVGNATVGEYELSPLARIFGGILGLINGFIIISLVREYILGRFIPETGIASTAAAPSEVSVTVVNIPQTSITDGLTPWVIIVAGILVVLLAIGSSVDYQGGKISKKPPLGYK